MPRVDRLEPIYERIRNWIADKGKLAILRKQALAFADGEINRWQDEQRELERSIIAIAATRRLRDFQAGPPEPPGAFAWIEGGVVYMPGIGLGPDQWRATWNRAIACHRPPGRDALCQGMNVARDASAQSPDASAQSPDASAQLAQALDELINGSWSMIGQAPDGPDGPVNGWIERKYFEDRSTTFHALGLPFDPGEIPLPMKYALLAAVWDSQIPRRRPPIIVLDPRAAAKDERCQVLRQMLRDFEAADEADRQDPDLADALLAFADDVDADLAATIPAGTGNEIDPAKLADAVAKRLEENRAKAKLPAGSETGQDSAGRPTVTWKDVQGKLLFMYCNGKPYTSMGDLAKRCQCSTFTVHEAIHHSTWLEDWAGLNTTAQLGNEAGLSLGSVLRP